MSWNWEKFTELTRTLVLDVLTERGLFNLYDDGRIETVSGNYASVYINGASQPTPNIPIRHGLTVSEGDEVRILNVNFNKRDRIVDHRKVI